MFMYFDLNFNLYIQGGSVMTVGTEEGDTASASEDGMDYLASLFQNADYKQIMQVNLRVKSPKN